MFGKQIPFDVRQAVTPSDYAAFGDHKKIFYGTIKPVPFSNANALIKRDVWKINKFNESIPGSEDRMWAKEVMANGLKIVYEPTSIVFHSHHDETLTQIRERSCINFFADLHYLKERKSKNRIIVSAGYTFAKDCVYLLRRGQINLILKMLTIRYARVKGRFAAYEKTEDNPFHHS